MSRESKLTQDPTRSQVTVEARAVGDAALVRVGGLVDERFTGFGDLGTPKIIAIDVSQMTRMTSFGVRQWLRAIDSLPKGIADLYLVGCPTFFVDQLNMVLNFGGPAKVLSVQAPYTCTSCGVESSEWVDVLAFRATLARGGVPEKECGRCGSPLEFDETPESYFAFVAKYGASNLSTEAAELLAAHGLYQSQDSGSEKPPKIIKLVHGAVTYFRIAGTIGSLFRARPFLVGAEGEVVIDLATVDRFDPAGLKEWRRLLKILSGQVPSVTLVDITESLLTHAPDTLTIARNIIVASVLVPYQCLECNRVTNESVSGGVIEPQPHICTTCGGGTGSKLSPQTLAPTRRAATAVPDASAKVIEQRDELVSRALTDANVAHAGDGAALALGTDDTVLGKYKIVRRLSAGGMAEVFLAKQVGIGGFEKPVALKRILRSLLESRHLAVELFLNEAKIAGRLTHPNIVQVLDVGEMGGALYLAMEFVQGKDLRDVLKKLQAIRGRIPLGVACYIVREIAQALHYAYWSTDMAGKQLAVVHRDVSPQNVILGFDGTVKLLDFGVAMSAVTEHEQQMVVGKWLYMSPEAATNQNVDHRSDLFSLGVVLYLLASGVMPFSGRDPSEIVRDVVAGKFQPLRNIEPLVPPALDELVASMLAARPEDRPPTGQDVVSVLTEIMRGIGGEGGPELASFLATTFPHEGRPSGVTLTPAPFAAIQRPSSASIRVPTRPQSSLGLEEAASGVTVVAPPPDMDVELEVVHKLGSGSVALPRGKHDPSVVVLTGGNRFTYILIAAIVIAVGVALLLLLRPG